MRCLTPHSCRFTTLYHPTPSSDRLPPVPCPRLDELDCLFSLTPLSQDSDDEVDDKDLVETESKRSTGRRGKVRELKASASAHVAHAGLARNQQSKKSCFW